MYTMYDGNITNKEIECRLVIIVYYIVLLPRGFER